MESIIKFSTTNVFPHSLIFKFFSIKSWNREGHSKSDNIILKLFNFRITFDFFFEWLNLQIFVFYIILFL